MGTDAVSRPRLIGWPEVYERLAEAPDGRLSGSLAEGRW